MYTSDLVYGKLLAKPKTVKREIVKLPNIFNHTFFINIATELGSAKKSKSREPNVISIKDQQYVFACDLYAKRDY